MPTLLGPNHLFLTEIALWLEAQIEMMEFPFLQTVSSLNRSIYFPKDPYTRGLELRLVLKLKSIKNLQRISQRCSLTNIDTWDQLDLSHHLCCQSNKWQTCSQDQFDLTNLQFFYPSHEYLSVTEGCPCYLKPTYEGLHGTQRIP